MYKVVAIVGESGTGKSTFLNKLVESNNLFHKVITSTTRPKRETEQHGIDYFFLTEQEMIEKIYNGNIIEAANFNGWVYGTSIDAFDEFKINIGVWNTQGIESLLDNKDLNVLILRLKAKDKIRMLRALGREKNPNVEEIARRYLADLKDFKNFDIIYKDKYIVFNNNNEIDMLNNLSWASNIIMEWAY